MSDYSPQNTMAVITYPHHNLSWFLLVKGSPGALPCTCNEIKLLPHQWRSLNCGGGSVRYEIALLPLRGTLYQMSPEPSYEIRKKCLSKSCSWNICNFDGFGHDLRRLAPVEYCLQVKYHQTSSISGIKSQHLNDSRLISQLSLANPLKPGVNLRIKT